jgi:hypothetical protein
MTRAKKKAIDALLRNSRQTKQLRLDRDYTWIQPFKESEFTKIDRGKVEK